MHFKVIICISVLGPLNLGSTNEVLILCHTRDNYFTFICEEKELQGYAWDPGGRTWALLPFWRLISGVCFSTWFSPPLRVPMFLPPLQAQLPASISVHGTPIVPVCGYAFPTNWDRGQSLSYLSLHLLCLVLCLKKIKWSSFQTFPCGVAEGQRQLHSKLEAAHANCILVF